MHTDISYNTPVHTYTNTHQGVLPPAGRALLRGAGGGAAAGQGPFTGLIGCRSHSLILASITEPEPEGQRMSIDSSIPSLLPLALQQPLTYLLMYPPPYAHPSRLTTLSIHPSTYTHITASPDLPAGLHRAPGLAGGERAGPERQRLHGGMFCVRERHTCVLCVGLCVHMSQLRLCSPSLLLFTQCTATRNQQAFVRSVRQEAGDIHVAITRQVKKRHSSSATDRMHARWDGPLSLPPPPLLFNISIAHPQCPHTPLPLVATDRLLPRPLGRPARGAGAVRALAGHRRLWGWGAAPVVIARGVHDTWHERVCVEGEGCAYTGSR